MLLVRMFYGSFPYSGARPRPTVRASFDVLVRAIIRPPRMFYTVKDLGDARLRMGTVIFFREDFKVRVVCICELV
jgi:hypothetical protein